MTHYPQSRAVSVLDLVATRAGEAPSSAIARSVELARLVEQLEYKRYWVAEHHAIQGLACSATPELIGVNSLTVTADGDIEHDRKEAEARGFRKITFITDFERAQESIREITNLIDAGLVHVPPINVLALGDAALAHQMIETGHVRGKLVLMVAELSC